MIGHRIVEKRNSIALIFSVSLYPMMVLNLLEYQPFLKTKLENGKTFLFCPIRKKYLSLQPEELVRQLLLIFLIQTQKFPKSKIAVEKSLIINDLPRRFDILIYDKSTQPFLLVECKAPKVKISQATFDQIAQYNLALKVPFLLVTNGIETYICQMDYQNQSYQFINTIPSPDNA